jgi:hypothetical protein
MSDTHDILYLYRFLSNRAKNIMWTEIYEMYANETI